MLSTPAPSRLARVLLDAFLPPARALTAQHSCQVVNTRQCVGMLFAQHRLPQPEYFSMHLFRLVVLALTAQHIRQDIHARQCVGMLFT